MQTGENEKCQTVLPFCGPHKLLAQTYTARLGILRKMNGCEMEDLF